MTLTEAQRTARAESWDSYLSTYGKFVQAGERNAFDFAFTAGLDYAKQEQSDTIAELVMVAKNFAALTGLIIAKLQENQGATPDDIRNMSVMALGVNEKLVAALVKVEPR